MGGARNDIRRIDTRPHIPVLLDEVMNALSPRDGEIYIDGTFGAGGYTRAILEHADCIVIAIDRDPDAIARGKAMQDEFGERLKLVRGCFGDMPALIDALDVAQVNGVTLDLGVSSMQLDEAPRGFSFMRDGPLDMRMGRDGDTAADMVNTLPEAELSQIISVYGEERRARAIAKAIVAHRLVNPITRTSELADIVEGVLGRQRIVKGKKQIHPATRTFQGLRIYLNDELGELMRGLEAAEQILSVDGRLAIVTFHSLEDRIVKKFYARRTGRIGRPSRHLPDVEVPESSFTEIIRGAAEASEAELKMNPRARSARLRAVARTTAARIGVDDGLLPRLSRLSRLGTLSPSRLPPLSGAPKKSKEVRR